MFNHKWFYRKGTKVLIDIVSKIETEKPVYPFSFEVSNENYAELLKEHLNEKLQEAHIDIAKRAISMLDDNPNELTRLKKALRAWNIKKQQWDFK